MPKIECPQEQDENVARLVMNTYKRVANSEGVAAGDIARYLRLKFGDVWRTSVLTAKAEDILRRSVTLGFLEHRGDRYMDQLSRQACSFRRKRKRRRRSCKRRNKPCCSCKRRRRRRRC